MGSLSYRLVHVDGGIVEGTDTSGVTATQFGDWHRENSPTVAEIAVWAGLPADRPVQVPALVGVA